MSIIMPQPYLNYEKHTVPILALQDEILVRYPYFKVLVVCSDRDTVKLVGQGSGLLGEIFPP